MERPSSTPLTADPNSKNMKIIVERPKSEEAALVRNTYDELVNVPVQFTSHLSGNSRLSLSAAENEQLYDRNDVSLQQRTSVQAIVLDSDVYEHWRQFASKYGLISDSLVASYLLHQYESTHSLKRCVHCQTEQPQYCSKCLLHVQTTLGVNPASSASPVIMKAATHVCAGQDNVVTSHPMGMGNSMELTTVSLTELQSSQPTQTSQVPTMKSSVGSSFISSAESKKSKSCKKKENKKKSPKQPYTCTECGSHVKPKQKTSRGKRRLTEACPYRCAVCNQAFPYRKALQDHLFTTENDGSHKCRHCPMTVLNAGDMRKHTLDHTAAMPYKCTHCKLAFSLACNLKTHMRTHSGEKPFTCSVCGRSFTQSIALKVHQRKHTGERPFVCPHCSMAFAASSNLSRHMLKHTGQKPYRCSFCSAAFSQPGSLKTHTRSRHTGERPYMCENCSATFSDHSTLWKHRRNNSCQSNSTSAARNRRQNVQSASNLSLVPASHSLPTVQSVAQPMMVPAVPTHSQTVVQQAPSTIVVSQDAALHLPTSVDGGSVHQLSTVSMTLLSAAASAVVGQQHSFQTEQHHLQLQQTPQQQQQTIQLQQVHQHQHRLPLHQQNQQQEQHAQQQHGQPAASDSVSDAAYMSNVNWYFTTQH